MSDKEFALLPTHAHESWLQEGLAEDIVVAPVGCVKRLAREVLLGRRHYGRVQCELWKLEWYFEGQITWARNCEHECQVRRRVDDVFELWVCGVPYVQVGVR